MRNGFDRALADARTAIAGIDGNDPSTYSKSLNRVALSVGRMLGYLEALIDSGAAEHNELERALEVVATFEEASGIGA
ncbi:MAG TPA: hypothetical protein VF160_06900 [Candidatus Dormibacteraeota bacterium]